MRDSSIANRHFMLFFLCKIASSYVVLMVEIGPYDTIGVLLLTGKFQNEIALTIAIRGHCIFRIRVIARRRPNFAQL